MSVLPSSAVTTISTLFSPTCSSSFPVIFTVAFECSGVATMLSFVISFGTFIEYSFTFLLNSGVITPSAICNADKFELSDFFVSAGFVVVLVDGFVVGFEGSVGVVGVVGVGCLIITLFDAFCVPSVSLA